MVDFSNLALKEGEKVRAKREQCGEGWTLFLRRLEMKIFTCCQGGSSEKQAWNKGARGDD